MKIRKIYLNKDGTKPLQCFILFLFFTKKILKKVTIISMTDHFPTFQFKNLKML